LVARNVPRLSKEPKAGIYLSHGKVALETSVSYMVKAWETTALCVERVVVVTLKDMGSQYPRMDEIIRIQTQQ
jgi:hypothetical protein